MGRGGAGNVIPGQHSEHYIFEAEDKERSAHPSAPALHSTGRGGQANIVGTTAPHIENARRTPPPEYQSSGRGGVGNFRAHLQASGPQDVVDKVTSLGSFLQRVQSGSRPRPDGDHDPQ
ncbi:hypothetical protein BV25DRAFT_1829122 [Artomyces pyxidatus]|uniref:Uncharacterized protein n=1 Tax=Artomyces pyxidatus TaxID=48021 RepID=A0ACB8SRW2_9AGAM|nr:hypothetical protein BV25DRAFT_1829122 [Artomyces pyxidatus]